MITIYKHDNIHKNSLWTIRKKNEFDENKITLK